ncbi:hypothetical protein [Bdellovibrio sp. HCB209]|uniref:hypothetical protein n=1 Tax=Bdellovibrio sp. HCB209 TaxID=3394354 RepID=UPI0039B4A4A1
MSRYHGPIVYMIVIGLVAGLVYVAEKTKDLKLEKPVTPPPGAVLIAQKNMGGFSMAQVLIEQEVGTLAKRGVDWNQHHQMVRAQVQKLPVSDMMIFRAKALDKTSALEERYVSVYLLSLAGMEAHHALFDIVRTPIVASKVANTKSRVIYDQHESAIRARAMVALDQLALVNPAQVQASMKKLAQLKSSPQIKNYARISLAGIKQGQPGKLSKYMNQTTASAEAM